jgi:hypothetical protein
VAYPLNTLGKTLTDQLSQILTGGDANVPPSPHTFVTWCSPGIPMTKEAFDFASLGFGAGADADAEKRLTNHAFNFAQLVDFVPDVSTAYTAERQEAMFRPDAENRLSTIYSEILRFSKVVHTELTDAEKAKIRKFRKLLRKTKTVTDIITDEPKKVTEDGPILKEYYAKQADYIAAALKYNSKRVAAQSATGVEGKAAVADFRSNAELYRMQVKSAMDAWTSGGYRNEVDAINAYIDQVSRRDMMLWKQSLVEMYNDAFVNGTGNGQRFPYTTLIPVDFAENGGWTEYAINHTSTDSKTHSESTSWSAGLGLNFGLFSLGANANGSSSQYSSDYQLSSFNLKLELCQVIISRPWFYSEFFTNRGWTLRPGEGWMYDAMPSDGSTPPNGPKGKMIGYPTIALFARDVTIESQEFVSAYKDYKSQIGVGGSVGWGPFRLGGSYAHSEQDTQVTVDNDGQSLKVNGMQLIGFVNHLLDKTPDPLPQLKPEDFA